MRAWRRSENRPAFTIASSSEEKNRSVSHNQGGGVRESPQPGRANAKDGFHLVLAEQGYRDVVSAPGSAEGSSTDFIAL